MKSIYKSYKFRLYPNIDQAILLNKHLGCTRFIYNYFLNFKKTEYETNKKTYSIYDIQKELTKLKSITEYKWLNEINSQSLQCELQNLNTSYTRFFNHRSNFPNYKSKKNSGSFKIPFQLANKINPTIRIETNLIYLPKFKTGIKFNDSRNIDGKILSITVSKTPTNKFFISICCKINADKLPQIDKTIGIDLGLKSFLVTSDNERIDNPNFLKKTLKKIKYLQKQYSKKQSKSNNKNKIRLKLCKQYEKITNKRTNFLHQISKKLINENQVICLEDLNVKEMVQNHSLAQSIHDVSWNTFVNFISYKADWYGRNIVFLNQHFPSSKMCSHCGYINQSLKLNDREWICPKCGNKHDRDYNAATNIHNVGMNWFNSDEINISKNISNKTIKTGSGTESVYKQKSQEASTIAESMNVKFKSIDSSSNKVY